MANSGFALDYSSPPSVERVALAAAGFALLLALIFIGTTPFDPPAASQDNMLRPAGYLAAFGLILIASLQRRGFGALGAVPLSIALLLIWCLASALWSAEP